MGSNIDDLSINTIRMLSADAVEKAQSGHPGLPMGAAAFAYTLWTKHLRHNPANPDWLNRDRFVLSAGHGSMLLYSLLHLTGYDLPMEEIKQFRQWDSKTPGHPEHFLTPGVETTTGPLGQGTANAVGMALAERLLADRYNTKEHTIVDYRTYALVSDGDLMEGISAEAASYAGSLKLGKLTFLYDSNRISIEGSTDLTFHDDTAKRFESYGWHVQDVANGNDLEAVDKALSAANRSYKPSLIVLHTHIGFGSPGKHDSASAHGSPLGAEELAATKKALGWPAEPSFLVPDEVREHMNHLKAGAMLEADWNKQFTAYQKAEPTLAKELADLTAGQQPRDWESVLPTFAAGEALATREASGAIMNAIASRLPLFIGGSADLGPSNNSQLKDFPSVTPGSWEHGARNLHFGIREHGMGGILNGMALSPQFIPYGATFFCFTDYMRASIRLAALMKLGVVYILTHDSIGQGEDGATHQPIEHLASLRAMPGLTLLRPADATETVEAWRYALENRHSPTLLVLTRQKVPTLDRTQLAAAANLHKGAYVLKDCDGQPDILLIATGSEVAPTLAASAILTKAGIASRVISMPSTELFEQQSDSYKASVLPESVSARLAVEAGAGFGWDRYVGPHGSTLTIDGFGASAPGGVMMEQYGFTPENIAVKARAVLKK